MSRTAKMWKSVGSAYWRTKEEKMRQLVEEVVMADINDDINRFVVFV